MKTPDIKKTTCFLTALVLAVFTVGGAAAETAAFRILPIAWQAAVLGQCAVPEGFDVYFEPHCCDETTALSYPLAVTVRAVSQDGNILLEYGSRKMFADASYYGGAGANYTGNGFDARTCMFMTDSMDAARVCDDLVRARCGDAFFRSEEDLSAARADLQALTEQYYRENPQESAAFGSMMLGVEVSVAYRTYTFDLNGETCCVSILAHVVEELWCFDGVVRQTYSIWEIPGYYMMICRLSDYETARENDFMPFIGNTSVSDQFLDLNYCLAELIAPQVLANGRMQSAADIAYSEAMRILADASAEGLAGMTCNRSFTGSVFSWKNYSLSDGTAVKLPVSVSQVFEGSGGEILFGADSAPDEAVLLVPDR